jgi:hypothetical protein
MGAIEPVDCNDAPADCFSNWGLDDGFFGAGGSWANPADGAGTGRVVFAKGGTGKFPITGFTNTTFGDGHAKAMTPGGLAVGTNYSGSILASAIQITNMSIYRFTQQ